MTLPWGAWETHAAWMADVDEVWTREVAAVAALGPDAVLAGRCDVCSNDAVFLGNVATDSVREGLHCMMCRSTGRQRAVAMVLMHGLADPRSAHVYTSEHATSFYVGLNPQIGHLHGSEYGVSWVRRLQMSTWLWKSRVYELVKVDDVTALSFADGSMDAIACQDVLEHVPDYRKALDEFVRVLKPRGTLVLTVPFYDDADASVEVARPDGRGGIEFIGEPEYHGDPVTGGVVCYHHFGWDLLQAMRDAGFARAVACRVVDLGRGVASGLWVLRATR